MRHVLPRRASDRAGNQSAPLVTCCGESTKIHKIRLLSFDEKSSALKYCSDRMLHRTMVHRPQSEPAYSVRSPHANPKAHMNSTLLGFPNEPSD